MCLCDRLRSRSSRWRRWRTSCAARATPRKSDGGVSDHCLRRLTIIGGILNLSAMTNRIPSLCASASLAAVLLLPAAASAPDSPTNGTVDVITVHGASLEGNLAGDSPDRRVSVYLPPSYVTAKSRRYPVVYLLHGFTDTDERWFGRVQHFINVPASADGAIGAGVREVMIVMPNAYTKFAGSMYSNSVVTGDWERFVTTDVVSY